LFVTGTYKNPINRRGQLGGNKTHASIAVAKIDPMKRYIYVKSADRIADLTTGQLIERPVFNATAGEFGEAGATGKQSAFAAFMNGGGMRVDRMVYEPGANIVFFEGDASFYNTWRPGIPNSETPSDVAAGDVAPWLDHVAYIWRDEKARDLFLNWAAFLIQEPGKKINWAPLLIGEQGVGKDLMLRPIHTILGKDNVRAIDAEDMRGTYQDWAESQLVIAEELPSYRKKDVYDWLKRYVATGTPHFSVNKKYLASYKVRNMQNWIIGSNNDDAVAIPPGDRRLFVYKTPAEKHPKGRAYYTPLAKLFEDIEFCAKLKAWLLQRDLSKFDPGEAPPWTAAKTAMMRATMAPFPAWLAGLFEEDGPFHGRRLITAAEIADYGRKLLDARTEPPKLRDRIGDPRAVGDALGKGIAGMTVTKIANSRLRYRLGENAQWLWALCTPDKYTRLSHDDLKRHYAKDREKRKEQYDSVVCPFPPVDEAKPEAMPEEESDSVF
jgi:hypothetical protein